MRESILCSYSYCKNVCLWFLFSIITLVIKTTEDLSLELPPPPTSSFSKKFPGWRHQNILMVLHLLPHSLALINYGHLISQIDPWIVLVMISVKSLLEMMTTKNNVYNGERFQLCDMLVRRTMWTDRIFLLSVSHPMVMRTTINFQGIKNRRDARRQLNEVQIFKRAFQCPSFLLFITTLIFFWEIISFHSEMGY